MSKVAPCLWFAEEAEEAAKFYVATFKACGQEAAIQEYMRAGEDVPFPRGSVLSVSFSLAGQEFIALNGRSQFSFSPAMSLFVTCADQAEVDAFWEKLGDGGEPVQCGWLRDRFGVSWQIVPKPLRSMMEDPDPVRAGRVMQAMMKMVKLDLPTLQKAYQGG